MSLDYWVEKYTKLLKRYRKLRREHRELLLRLNASPLASLIDEW